MHSSACVNYQNLGGDSAGCPGSDRARRVPRRPRFSAKTPPSSISSASSARTPGRFQLTLVAFEAQMNTLAWHAELEPVLVRVRARAPEDGLKWTREAQLTMPILGTHRVELPIARAKRFAADCRRGVCLSFDTTDMPLASAVEPQ